MTADELDRQLEQVSYSVRRYRRSHRRYERRHTEIFNPVEQARLREALAGAVASVTTGTRSPRALDVGCGSGNVTRHLLELGLEVIAADVSPAFLNTVRRRFGARVQTLRLNGVDLSGVPDESVDLVAAYSVLHHIPDYLAMLDEVARVLRPGGVVFLDHEATDDVWDPHGAVEQFHRALRGRQLDQAGWWDPDRRRWQRYLMPVKYAVALRRLVDPSYEPLLAAEGDIHVWREDHVEWDAVAARLRACGLTVVSTTDYLNFDAAYPRDLFEEFRERGCADTRTLVARRPTP